MKNLFKIYLLMLYLALQVDLSFCSKGCLSCKPPGLSDTRAICWVCDHAHGYYSDGGLGCIERKIPNCEVHSVNINEKFCHRCKQNFYLDHPSKICTPIPSSAMINFCLYYHHDLSCNQCDQGFYLSGGRCKKVNTSIENCVEHANPEDCKHCAVGFFFDRVELKCKEFNVQPNCKVYSNTRCEKCMSGFFRVTNFLSGSEMSPSQVQYLFNIDSKEFVFERTPMNRCVKGRVNHCADFKTFDQCQKCHDGYFLDINLQCQEAVQYKIPFCSVYSDPDHCEKCQTGLFLKNNRCYETEKVDSCLEFDEINGKCLMCDNKSHYMSGDGCAARKNSLNIEHCTKTSDDSDECVECLMSFRLTDDRLKCLPHVAHCKEYVTSSNPSEPSFSSINSLSMRCEECDLHFYLSDDSLECLPQKKPNCAKFVENSSSCEKCADGYFKDSDDNCQIYTVQACADPDPNADACNDCLSSHFKNAENVCEAYSVKGCKELKSDANECDSCYEHYFMKDNKCLPYTKLNCKTFKTNADECETCYNDFYLDDDSKNCMSSVSLNCVVLDSTNGRCNVCRAGYYLHSASGKCLTNTALNCSNKSTNSNDCLQCDENYFKNEDGICKPYTKKNCKSPVSNKDECLECNTDFVLTSSKDCEPVYFLNCLDKNDETGVCNGCELGYKLTPAKNCEKILVQGCKTYDNVGCTLCHDGLYLNEQKCLPSNLRYCSSFDLNGICTGCVKGHKLNDANKTCDVVQLPNCSVPQLPLAVSPLCDVCQRGYYNDGGECKSQTITNCAIFSPNLNECLECSIGFNLQDSTNCTEIVPVSNCFILKLKDKTKCSVCFYGYFLNKTTELCEAITSIDNCIQYKYNSKECLYCSEGKKPNTNGLACEDLTPVANCEIHDLMTYECKKCDTGYYYDQADKSCKKQSITNCDSFMPNMNICSKCSSNFILMNNICYGKTSPIISNCLQYESFTSCKICDSGFYTKETSEGNRCELQKIENCFIFNNDSTNTCAQCFNGYIVDENGGCKTISLSNCIEAHPTKEECLICEAEYYIGSDKTCEARVNYGTSENCTANSSTDERLCDRCAFGYHSMSFTNFKFFQIQPLDGCLSYDHANQKCTECLPNYQFVYSGAGMLNKCAKPADPSTSVCRKLSSTAISTATTNVPLSSANSCETCMPEFYFDNSNPVNCVAYGENHADCSSVDTTGNCTECYYPYSLTSDTNNNDKTFMACLGFDSAFTSLANCSMYNTTGTCIMCDQGYTLTDTAGTITCETSTVLSLKGVNSERLTVFNVTTGFSSSDGVKAYLQQTFSSQKANIFQCDFEYIPLNKFLPGSTHENNYSGMKYAHPTTPSLTTTAMSSIFQPNPTILLPETCENIAAAEPSQPKVETSYAYSFTQTPTFTSKCSNWIPNQPDNTFDKIFCLACSSGQPIHTNFKGVSGGPIADIYTIGVKECVDPTNFVSEPYFADLQTTNPGSSSGLGSMSIKEMSLSLFTNYDICDTTSKPLNIFLMVLAKVSQSFIPIPYKINNSGTPADGYNAICVELTDANYFVNGDTNIDVTQPTIVIPGAVTNCQVHVHVFTGNIGDELAPINIPAAASNPVEGTTLMCGGCQPGYHPYGPDVGGVPATRKAYLDNTDLDHGITSSCTAVLNCDMASPGSILNGCQNCATNFTHQFNHVDKQIDWHVCVSDSLVPNCILTANDGTDDYCVLCDEGYTINFRGNCESMANDFRCSAPISGYGLWNFDGSDNIQTVTYLQKYILSQTGALENNQCSCSTTDTIYYPVLFDQENPSGKCFSSAFFTDMADSNQNCEIADPSDRTKCEYCKNNFILDEPSANINFTGTCKSVIPLTGNYPSNCALYDSVASTTTCIRCKNGYEFSNHPLSKYCVSKTDYPENCDKFNETDNYCEVCEFGYNYSLHISGKVLDYKNCNLTVITSGQCGQVMYNGICLECFRDRSQLPSHIHISERDPTADVTDFTAYKHECVAISEDIIDLLPFTGVAIINDTTNKRLYVEESFKATHYFTTNDPSEFAQAFPVTSICLPSNSTLADFTTDTCDHYDKDGGKCLYCKDGKHPNNAGGCENITVGDECWVKDAKGFCAFCYEGSELTDDRTDCQAKTSSNTPINDCEKHSADNSSCLICNGEKYWDGSACTSYSPLNNCLLKDPSSDACLKCISSYYLNAQNKCVYNLVENCLIPTDKEGECLFCKEGYKFDSLNKCVIQPTNQNCYKSNELNVCEKCNPGFILNSSYECEAILLKTIEGCANYDQTGFTCIECIVPFKLYGGKCLKEYSGPNCLRYHENLPICTKCQENYFNRNGICELRTNLKCKTVIDTMDACSACEEDMYLKDHDCHSYMNNEGCLYKHPTEDKCLTCENHYYMNSRTQTCMKKIDQNCLASNPLTGKCSLCDNKFYLNVFRQCIPISDINCDVNDPFADVCVKCKDGYFINDTDYNLSLTPKDLSFRCIPYTIENCEVYHPTSNQCLTCKSNHLNKGGKCVMSEESNTCLDFDSANNKCLKCLAGKSFLWNNKCYTYSVSNCESYSTTSDECLTCKDGFYITLGTCMKHTSVGCQLYSQESDACEVCQQGFYLELNHCKLNTSSNCQKKSTESNICLLCNEKNYMMNGRCIPHVALCDKYHPYKNECLTCKQGTYLDIKNKLCVAHTVQNCASYHFSMNACTTCVENFYLKNGSCYNYSVTDCARYHPMFDQCISCKEGFYQADNKCIKYSVSNCNMYSPVNDICLNCLEGYFYTQNGNCQKYELDNCALKDPNMNSCLKCEDDSFYLMKMQNFEFICVKLTPVEHCEEYSPHSDQCEKCSSTHFLDKSDNECHLSSKMINHCDEYESLEACNVCEPPYFVMKGLCHQSDLIIPKCIRYESNQVCGECDENHLVSEDKKQCLAIQESSCLTYLDISNCKTCPDDKVLSYIDNSNFDQVSGVESQETSFKRSICVDSGIPNCAFARESYPNNICIKCDSGFYLSSDNECSQVINEIEGCETYFSDGICSECKVNKILSPDKLTCQTDLTLIGENCKEGKIFSEPQCVICQSGFFLNEDTNQCEKCALTGCSVCSSSQTECIICKSGFYMDETKTCIRTDAIDENNAKVFVADDGIERSDGNTEIDNAVSIVKVYFMTLIVSIFNLMR